MIGLFKQRSTGFGKTIGVGDDAQTDQGANPQWALDVDTLPKAALVACMRKVLTILNIT